MKSMADIVAEELDKVMKSPKVQKILEEMDKINPSGLCLLCAIPVGTGHLLCPGCYLREGVNMK